MLNWNAQKIRTLKPGEIWLFIIARVFVAFGVGVLAAKYFPDAASTARIPAIVLGLMLFAVAAKGLFRSVSS